MKYRHECRWTKEKVQYNAIVVKSIGTYDTVSNAYIRCLVCRPFLAKFSKHHVRSWTDEQVNACVEVY
jgi:putative component of membrane protein insertase Oxa1/YidC/SpoIIIJ protein YidD